MLLQPGAVGRARALDVDPAQAVGLEDLDDRDLGASGSRRAATDGRASARRPAEREASAGSASGTSRFVGRASGSHRVRSLPATSGVARTPRARATSAPHSWTHPEGWRDWPDETPATTPRNAGTVPIPERCGRSFSTSLRHANRRRFFNWQQEALKCRECGATYPLDARYVCERCFGPLEVAYATPALADDVAGLRRRIQGGPQNIWRYADFLPLDGAARPSARVLARRPARRLHAADPGRPAGRAARPRRGVGQERRRQPDALVQGPRRLRRRGPRPRARLRGPGLRLDRQPGQLRRRPRRRAGPARPTSSSRPTSRSRRSSPPASTGRTSSRSSGNYDDVNRLCTELSGERDWAFVNVNMRPYYAEGSKTLAYEIAEQLGWEHARPRRRADRLRLAVHEDRQGLRGVARARARRAASVPAMNGAQAAGLLAGRARRSPPGTTSAARSSPTRSPSRWPSATRPTARTRSSSRAARGGGDRRRHRRRDPRRASACWPRRPASSPRPPAA